MNYLNIKKRGSNKVVPEIKPPALKLVALKESVPAITKAKRANLSTMDEAWKLLDLDYRNLQEVQAKLKE